MGLVGLVVGLVVGIGVAWSIRHRRSGEARELDGVPQGTAEPALPDGVAEVISRLPFAAAVIGAEDEVLQSTTPARTLGLVRGSRIAVDAILAMVRTSRRDEAVLSRDLELARGTATVYLSVRVAPLHGGLVLMLCEDTTTERRVETTRRDFVVNVSHELKTPIGAISLLAEAVEQAAGDPEAVRRFSHRMLTEAERLTVLVAQVIQLSRLQADQPLTHAEPIGIDEVIAGAVDRCRVDADRHGVSLTIAGDRGCHVLGDAAELETAVGNLVENAVAYSDNGARVVVAAHVVLEPTGGTEHADGPQHADGTEPTGGTARTAPSAVGTEQQWIEVTVSDNGIGIAAADLDRIFERFYRVDYARSRANGGTGLGLSIVKHVATVHGGHVDVWSQPGHGSTFSIRLPALSTPPEPDHSIDRAAEPHRPTQEVS